MKEIYENYDLMSYNSQRDVCRLRRECDFPCRNCRYYTKCKKNHRIVDRLNTDLKEYKTRYVY